MEAISVGGAGTTYLFDTTTNDSTLIINNGIYSNTAITNISNTISDGKFTNLNITNTTIYGTALNITKTVTFNPGTIYLNTPIIGNSNVTITNNSILTVTGNALNLINITANTINIVSGSAINVTGKGYAGGSNTGNGAGPGYGIGSSLGSCGASYAGMGGKGYGVCTINTITYGDIINPMMFGSGEWPKTKNPCGYREFDQEVDSDTLFDRTPAGKYASAIPRFFCKNNQSKPLPGSPFRPGATCS